MANVCRERERFSKRMQKLRQDLLGSCLGDKRERRSVLNKFAHVTKGMLMSSTGREASHLVATYKC